LPRFWKRDMVPFFIEHMINKQLIQKMAEDFLRDTDNYLIEVKVSAANKILVHIGNDQHVAIGDCVALSRKIEHSLDREAEDFELEVSSPGIEQPFKVLRQYQKYLGKDVEIKTSNGLKYSGVLTSATDQEVTLLPKFKKSNKKSIKSPANAIEHLKFSMEDIAETRLVIKI
jgi:ribosome maturation factor RimP